MLVKEQQALAVQAATSTLSALRLRQRLVILERYFIALNRAVAQESAKVKWKSSSGCLPSVDKKRYPRVRTSLCRVEAAAVCRGAGGCGDRPRACAKLPSPPPLGGFLSFGPWLRQFAHTVTGCSLYLISAFVFFQTF